MIRKTEQLYSRNAGIRTCAGNFLPENEFVRSVCFFYLVPFKLHTVESDRNLLAPICAGALLKERRTNCYSTGAGGNECAFSNVGTVSYKMVLCS
jgi:hypothetical protein